MRALILAAMLVAPIPVAAAPGPNATSARAFLQSIYVQYHKGGHGASMTRPERWFEPRLAAAIRKDAAAADRRGDVGKLDGDPFCDCQDFESPNAVIGPVAIQGTRASVRVSFRNGDQISMRYTLLWTRDGWRVFDIQWKESALREMYFPR